MRQRLTTPVFKITLALAAFGFAGCAEQKGDEPWSEEQLMAPSELATIIAEDTDAVHIYNIGPLGRIKSAVDIGEGSEEENIEKLRKELEGLQKKADIVLYCGCCPFDMCPNIRSAFGLLNEMKFKNHKLLNLPENLKVDWIEKGYPLEDD